MGFVLATPRNFKGVARVNFSLVIKLFSPDFSVFLKYRLMLRIIPAKNGEICTSPGNYSFSTRLSTNCFLNSRVLENQSKLLEGLSDRSGRI